GFAKRLLVSASRRSGIIAGYAIGALARWLITVCIVTGVALAAGMKVKGDGIDLVGMYSLAVLVNIAFLLWASGVAMTFRSVQAGPIMQTPVFLILYFAPVYVPLGLLRGWIHGVAVANPLTRLIEAVRSLLAGQPFEVGIAYGVAVG